MDNNQHPFFSGAGLKGTHIRPKANCSARVATLPRGLSNPRHSTWMFLIGAAFVGVPAHAEVLVSEVAWMGYLGDTNNEWIELWNNGSSNVDLTGWTLMASDGTPSISLSGTISANGYFLLERTDDTSVSGITADQIYVGALSNTGETLVLKNKSGAVVDTVSGGTDWAQIGGDSGSGDTPQRTASGWVTGKPTPKATSSGASEANSSGSSSGQGDSQTAGVQTIQAGTLYLDAPYTMTVIAGADTLFGTVAYDDQGRESARAEYRWNFGNGVTKTGARVYYAYALPGEYTATISVTDGYSSGDAQIDVAVLPPEVYVGHMTQDAVFIENRGAADADLSAWKVRQTLPNGEVKELSFPPYSIVRAGHEVPLAHLDTGFVPGLPVTLHFPNGEKVTYAGRQTGTTYTLFGESQPISATPRVEARQSVIEAPSPASLTKGMAQPSTLLSAPPMVLKDATPLELSAAATKSNIENSWIVGVWILVVVLGVGLLVFLRRFRRKEELPL